LKKQSFIQWKNIVSALNIFSIIAGCLGFILFIGDDQPSIHYFFWTIYIFDVCLEYLFSLVTASSMKEICHLMQYFVLSFQMALFVHLSHYNLASIIFYAVIIVALLIGAVIIYRLEYKEQMNGIYKLDKDAKNNPFAEQTYLGWKQVLLFGLQTLPYIYYSKESSFHSEWFYVAIILFFILFPHILRMIDCMVMNIGTGVAVEWYRKQYDDALEITKSQIAESNISRKVFFKSKGIRIWSGIRGMIFICVSVGWTMLLFVLCALHIWHLERGKRLNYFEIGWSSFAIAWPTVFSIWLCSCGWEMFVEYMHGLICMNHRIKKLDENDSGCCC
jgi:hypothetical protein